MANSSLIHVFTLIFLLLHFHGSAGTDARASSENLIHSSCVHASYPDICVRTLSAYPEEPPQNRRELAKAAADVSLSHAKKLSKFLKEQKAENKREKTALKNCLEQMIDSMDELKKTLTELEHLKMGSFGLQMSNAETWVSAALSDEETCLDELKEAAGKGKQVKVEVRKRVVGLAKVTSNALYLITQLDAKRG